MPTGRYNPKNLNFDNPKQQKPSARPPSTIPNTNDAKDPPHPETERRLTTTRLRGHTTTFEKLTQPTPLQARALELTTNAPVVVK